MTQWIILHLNDLMWTVAAAVLVACAVGLRRGMRGAAIFVSGFNSAVLVVIAYPWFVQADYPQWVGYSVLAPICGGLQWAIFGVVAATSDSINEQRHRLARQFLRFGGRLLPGDGISPGRKQKERDQ